MLGTEQCSVPNCQAQSKFILELAGSFDVPVGNAKGELGDFFKFQNYGLVYGIGFHFNMKYAATQKLFPYFTAGFTHLQNDEDTISFIDSNLIRNGYPLPGNQIYNSTPGTSMLIIRNFYAGLGLQYFFNSSQPLMPFAGIEITYNYIIGFYEQNPKIVPGSEGVHKEIFDIKPASRIGIGINIGADYRLAENLGFVFGIKYSAANLLGKNSERTLEKNTIALLDKSAPELNSHLNKDRNIGYLQLYVGFSVFLGRKL